VWTEHDHTRLDPFGQSADRIRWIASNDMHVPRIDSSPGAGDHLSQRMHAARGRTNTSVRIVRRRRNVYCVKHGPGRLGKAARRRYRGRRGVVQVGRHQNVS
jgi:hypothetical protein